MKIEVEHKLNEKQKEELMTRLDRMGNQTETLLYILEGIRKGGFYWASGIGIVTFVLGLIIGKLL